MAEEAPPGPPTGKRPTSAFTDIDRFGVDLAESLLEDIDPATGGFGHSGSRSLDTAAHQLLWARYMTTGAARFGEAVVRSLRTICRSASCAGASNSWPASHPERTLSAAAQLLELLTWVWRVERCQELRLCAEAIAARVVAQMRVTGSGFAERTDGTGLQGAIGVDGNGPMLVALIEAGSVFERRDWLALAREVFDEIAVVIAGTGTLQQQHDDGTRGSARRRDDDAAMSRAALRLFEAFGKQRYLDLAETWVARWDTTSRDITERLAADTAPTAGDSLMIGVLARLHALTGGSRYAQRAEDLAETLYPAIVQAGTAGVTAVANAQTAARLLSIAVSGDPRLVETREIMRVALDCGLPDRLVLGPGAGTPDERPLARICVGANRLAPIDDAARLHTMLAPGGLAAAFLAADKRETVDSRRTHGIP